MNWLKRKIRNWLDSDKVMLAPDNENSLDWDPPLRFTLTRAQGGYIINTRRYDRVKDRNEGSIYILTDDQNLSEEMGKIVSMEMLRLPYN